MCIMGSAWSPFYNTLQGTHILIAWDTCSDVALILAFITRGLLNLVRTHDT